MLNTYAENARNARNARGESSSNRKKRECMEIVGKTSLVPHIQLEDSVCKYLIN